MLGNFEQHQTRESELYMSASLIQEKFLTKKKLNLNLNSKNVS